jgi:hypothetical protein
MPTSRPSPLTWLPLWTRALDEEIGIRFRISGVPRENFRSRLYECREQSGDPRLQDLIMFLPATPETLDEIWICRKQVELEP